MDISVETITPKTAEAWLEKYNNKNRKMSRKVVERYASDMQRGNWSMTGDAIRFNGTGTLLDGQHRLKACVAANKPFKSIVIRGLSSQSQNVMDAGIRRSFGHALAIRGVGSWSQAAAVTTSLYKIKHKISDQQISHAALMPLFEKHKKGILEATRLVERGKPKGLSRGVVGALYHVCAHGLNDQENADAMLDVFCKGSQYYSGDAMHQLREELINLRARKTPPTTRAILWTAVNNFNAFRDEVPVRKINWIEKPVAVEGLNYRKI
jgi:hypothetical protein